MTRVVKKKAACVENRVFAIAFRPKSHSKGRLGVELACSQLVSRRWVQGAVALTGSQGGDVDERDLGEIWSWH
jgi:hypothetical protein